MRRLGYLVATIGLVAAVLATAGAPATADGNEMPGAPVAARSVSAGENHTCALLAGGRVKCWGANNVAQLGLGDIEDRGDEAGEMGDALPAVDLGPGRTATAISAGGNHTCAILDTGALVCWGAGANGRLGRGDTQIIGDTPTEMGPNLVPVALGTGRTAVAVSAAEAHTCAILDNGQVKCWGKNLDGELGQGDNADRGDDAGELGDALPVVDLGTGLTASAIAAGDNHTCVILNTGRVKCWGYNFHGTLGLGDTVYRGDDAGEMGDALPLVDLGTNRTATAITAGSLHNCVILDNGQVKCWGYNDGSLGLEDSAGRGNEAGEMGDDLPAVDLGTGLTALGISTSADHTCALLTGGAVKCFGTNIAGQGGQGHTEPIGRFPDEMGDDLPPVQIATGRFATAVLGGGRHSCARLDDDSLRCWGRNDSGQLGVGDPDGRGDGPDEMGDALPVVDLGSPPPTAVCGGRTVTVDLNLGGTPTAGADVILGTPAGNVINALGGADTVCGGGGNDTVNAGPGNDRVFGQVGNDRLNGNVGADYLDGGSNNDRLDGGSQRDTCNGRTGTDTQVRCEARAGIP